MTDTRPRIRHVSAAVHRAVQWPQDSEMVRKLFLDYREWVADHSDTDPNSRKRVTDGLALIDRLIADLPQTYGPPNGDLLLWFHEGSVVACGALREIEPGVGEIRRIYVRPDFRGGEFGAPFVRTLIERARELHFQRVQADTLPTMQGAIEFYRELGFRLTTAFWPHPAAGALFFEREVDSKG